MTINVCAQFSCVMLKESIEKTKVWVVGEKAKSLELDTSLKLDQDCTITLLEQAERLPDHRFPSLGGGWVAWRGGSACFSEKCCLKRASSASQNVPCVAV